MVAEDEKIDLTEKIEKVIEELDNAAICIDCILRKKQENCGLGYGACPWEVVVA